jgi:TPR repeat protein
MERDEQRALRAACPPNIGAHRSGSVRGPRGQWMRRAAEGIVNAQYWYGRMLVEGRSVQTDAREGRAWIVRAAGAGMAEAEVALAEMMLNGRGGRRDSNTARARSRKPPGVAMSVLCPR